MHISVSNAISTLQKQTPTVTIRQTSLAGEGLAKVVVEVVHTTESHETPSLVLQALNAATGNKLKAVASTFRRVSTSRFKDTLVGVMSVNRQVKPYTEESAQGFRSVSSNMFMDKEQDMWRLEETAAGKMLVKENAAESISDMKELLSSLCSSSPWKAEASATLNVRGGDFVSFVALSGQLNYGFVAASLSTEDFLVVPLVGDSTEVKLDAITQVVEGESIPDLEVEENAQTTLSAARNKSGVDELIEFYRRIYGQNKEFFNALVSRIKQQNFA